MKTTPFLLVAILTFSSAASVLAQVPRQMSYQGIVLDASGAPISDGSHTLKVSLYDAPTGGAALYTETQSINTLHGLCDIIIGEAGAIPSSLDFSQQYWMGISVDGSTELAPRTALTSAPYALHSQIADRALSVSTDAQGVVTSINEVDGPVQIVGDSTTSVTQQGRKITISSFGSHGGGGGIASIQSPQKTLSITYPTGPVTSIDVRDSSIGTAKLTSMGATSGQVLTWSNGKWAPADPPSGGGGGTGWLTSGNSGTFAGSDFVGTTDSVSLDLRANNIVGLRLNPNGALQHDASGNARGKRAVDLQMYRNSSTMVASGDASVIGGGDYNTGSGTNSVVSGGITNSATASYSAVGGGGNNSATDLFAVVGGGGHNTASSTYATVGGGESNLASGNGSVIGGGVTDTATTYGATIAGGTGNVVRGVGGTIGGGATNTLAPGYYGVIAGGQTNVLTGGDGSSIGGGIGSKVNGSISTIAGGYNNYIGGDASTILGGAYLRLVGDNSLGFLGGRLPADSAVVTASNTAFFGNVDLWIGSTDSSTHQLRFYEAQNGGITYPGTNTNYTAFKAGTQTSNITYTLPDTAAVANGALLTSSTSGQWSWSANAVWDGSNKRLGLNTTAPATTADVNGDVAMREHQVTVNNGQNNNLAVGGYSFIQLTGANAAFGITGIASGMNGKMIVLYNATGQAMTITNNDANSAAGNKIFTGNGNAYTTPNGYVFDAVTLMYSASKGGWLLISHN